MHCSANVGKDGDSALFFGLSGTGKTTLSADPNRTLIGDDEHGWGRTASSISKAAATPRSSSCRARPSREIWDATNRFGTVLENVVFDPVTRVLDLDDGTKTENTRSAYPIDFIPNASRTGRAGHPKNIIFLTADAFGVMPPIAKLTPTRRCIISSRATPPRWPAPRRVWLAPQPAFSTCFGAPFMPRHPSDYGNLLRDYIDQAWRRLLAGQFRLDRRQIRRRPPHADQGDARAADAALNGSLKDADFRTDPYFGFSVPTSVPGVEPHLLNPFKTWKDKAEFDKTARELVGMFQKNFTKFENTVDASVGATAPDGRIAAE